MAVTGTQTVDVAQVLATAISDVDGLRVEWYPADKARPPVAVIGQSFVDYTDTDAGFCNATFEVPVSIVVARNNDRDAILELSRLLSDVVTALHATDVDAAGVFSIQVLDARSGVVTINGQELPAYNVRVQVRA